MRTTVRFLVYVTFAAALAVPAAAQSQERVTLTVAKPTHLGPQALSPGAYDVIALPTRGVFTVEEKNTARPRKKFVQATSAAEGFGRYQNHAAVEFIREATGDYAITSLYFPQTGLTYSFSAPTPMKESGVRAAAKP